VAHGQPEVPGKSRRSLLVAAAGAVALAGCADRERGATTPTDERTTPTGTADGLDLREANVVAVDWDGEAGEGVEFAVTLYHDDDGEDGYANWWQVETLEGDRLGRRDLLHAHGTREFTRSDQITVPAGTDCVVVRGHDRTHGYGGRAMLVNLASGGTRAAEQGVEPRSFSVDDCP
jgi:hypothetical protein